MTGTSNHIGDVAVLIPVEALKTFEPGAPVPVPVLYLPGFVHTSSGESLSADKLRQLAELIAQERGLVGYDLIPPESLRLVRERLAANTGKHGAFDPKPLRARLDSIGRHLKAARKGETSASEPARMAHLCAIACHALFGMERERLDIAATSLEYPPHHDPTEREP